MSAKSENAALFARARPGALCILLFVALNPISM
jgi:hypothetical protein